MCGILGSVDLPFGDELLAEIRHRGPDDGGIIEHSCGARRVFLGHRRLAILDLTPSGAQPMSTPDGSGHLIYNGEIYNHEDLRAGLGGIDFRGHSDTETLLHAIDRFGIEAVRRLNGIFGFAYLDLRRRRLYLARDPFGVKPIYYSVSGDRLCFASELSPVLRLVRGEVDPHALARLLRLRFSPSPDTLFGNIRKLRPGHILDVDLSGDSLALREYSYVDPVAASARGAGSLESATGEYGRLFEQAVARQLMSDVEIGVLLSGGVDSALVAASVQRQRDVPVKAFTVGFTDQGDTLADETDDARETAKLLGLEHHTAQLGFGDFLDTLRECVRIVEEPLATTSIVPMHYLAQLAGEHVKVVMSGQGADEPLGGYGRYQGELIRRWVPPALARVGLGVATTLGVKRDTVLRGLSALSHGEDVERFEDTYSVFREEEIRRLTGYSPKGARERVEAVYDLVGCRALPVSVARMMAIDLRFGLSDDLLLYTDKITMRQSLECRVPILDHELVEFIEALPAEFRVTRGATKIIHKRYAEKTLPAQVVHRPKKGFLSPTRTWFRDGARLRSILLATGTRFGDFFDLGAVDDVLREHERGYNRERQIFLLLCLHFWFDEYG